MRADFKRAGKLVNVSSRRPALFSSSSHDHPADRKQRGSETVSLELCAYRCAVAQHAKGSFSDGAAAAAYERLAAFFYSVCAFCTPVFTLDFPDFTLKTTNFSKIFKKRFAKFRNDDILCFCCASKATMQRADITLKILRIVKF